MDAKLNRYNVKLINSKDKTDCVYTHTWATNHLAAQTRINRELAGRPDIWEGWTYELSY